MTSVIVDNTPQMLLIDIKLFRSQNVPLNNTNCFRGFFIWAVLQNQVKSPLFI